MIFAEETVREIQSHAIDEWPREACGYVTGAGYVRCANIADDPALEFEIGADWIGAGAVAIVHSHVVADPSVQARAQPDAIPSVADMAGQIATGLPWGIVATDGRECTVPWFWGGTMPRPALLGRQFRHGPSGTDGKGDCYAIIRDYFDAVYQIDLPEFPRDLVWWRAGGDLYRQGFTSAGFTRVDGEPREGDVLLGQVRSTVPNHGVVYIGSGLMMHHLENRLSVREPIGRWHKFMTHHLRHKALA